MPGSSGRAGSVEPCPEECRAFRRLLTEWWAQQNFEFSWRRQRDPFLILVAEVLLRKTTASQVEGVYEDLVASFPTVASMAKASEKRLLLMLRPLGMERVKAKLLVSLAREIESAHGGFVPTTKRELTSLPGIGSYSASAVLSISYGQREPMLDTNVIRLLDRVFGIKSQKARARDDLAIWEFAKNLLPKKHPGNFNLAMIDLARTICTHSKPRCIECPLRSDCRWSK